MQPETTDSGATLTPPEDFAEYEKWRATPAVAAPATPSEAADKPAESTAPESETGKTPQELEAEEAEDLSHKGLKKRFSKLTGKIRELETQLATRQPAPAAVESKPGNASPAAVTETPGKPVASSFDTYEAYVESLADWKFEQREQARARADSERQAAETQKTRASAWLERVEAAKAEDAYADWDDVVADIKIDDTRARPAIREFLEESEFGPKIAYLLATKPDELKRIAALSPVRAVAELGKIEGSLVTTPETPKPKTTSAPRPPTAVTGQAGNSSRSIYDEKFAAEDFGAWERERNAQLSRR